MGIVQKINFPYLLENKSKEIPPEKRLVIFFGTNFWGVPLGWNLPLFIESTNRMLEYIRRNFPGRRLFYQPHPNETDEYTRLNLNGFVIGERTVAELFLYTNAKSIEYIFSACSGASTSAFAMGFNAAIFLDVLHRALPEESITIYRSYFAKLPESFFINSFTQPVPIQSFGHLDAQTEGLAQIYQSLGGASDIWFLVSDPSLMVKAMLLTQRLRQFSSKLKFGLIQINSQRWNVVAPTKEFLSRFDRVIKLAHQGTVRYSARPSRILSTINIAWALKKLPITPGAAIISFANMLFEENCILSFYHWSRKISFIEYRWYAFTFEANTRADDDDHFQTSQGQSVFYHLIEPLLGLNRTVFRQSKGKVLDYFRYQRPLEEIYDSTFILMPGTFSKMETLLPVLSGPAENFFWRRVWRSNFGLKKIKALVGGFFRRRQVLKALKGGQVLTTRRGLQVLLGAPALINDEEVVVLQKYAQLARETIVEIGAAYGGSALLFLLSKKKSAQVYSIDPFVQDSMGNFQATRKLCFSHVTRALTDTGLDDRIKQWELLPDYSYMVIKHWRKLIDLLFVDGDHHYQAVKQDFADWFPLVKKGGLILFHDSCQPIQTPESKYDRGWPGPSRLVRELQRDSRITLVKQIHSLSIFKKT